MSRDSGVAKSLIGVLFLMAGIFRAGTAYCAEDTQKDLAKASTFTVKIKRTIEYPFFDDQRGSPTAAGFLVDKERGWIATAAHVSGRNPNRIEIAFKGRSYSPARLVYVDPVLDLAVVETSRKNLPSFATNAALACKAEPKIGSAVLAFGHPQYMEFSGSRGIISALPYRFGSKWIQSDASASGGSSGGPLLDSETGKVIGVATGGWSQKSIGISQLIAPLCKILSLLRKGKDPSPYQFPYLIANDPDTEIGLNVVKVFKGKAKNTRRPALSVGDKILGFTDANGTRKNVETFYDLIEGLRGLKNPIRLNIQKGAKTITAEIKLQKFGSILERRGLYFSGMVIAPLARIGDELINPNSFLVVHNVKKQSPAYWASIKKYDRITRVDGLEIKTVPELCRHLTKKAAKGKKVRLILERHQNAESGLFKVSLIDIEVTDPKQVGYGVNGKECTHK